MTKRAVLASLSHRDAFAARLAGMFVCSIDAFHEVRSRTLKMWMTQGGIRSSQCYVLHHREDMPQFKNAYYLRSMQRDKAAAPEFLFRWKKGPTAALVEGLTYGSWADGKLNGEAVSPEGRCFWEILWEMERQLGPAPADSPLRRKYYSLAVSMLLDLVASLRTNYFRSKADVEQFGLQSLRVHCYGDEPVQLGDTWRVELLERKQAIIRLADFLDPPTPEAAAASRRRTNLDPRSRQLRQSVFNTVAPLRQTRTPTRKSTPSTVEKLNEEERLFQEKLEMTLRDNLESINFGVRTHISLALRGFYDLETSAEDFMWYLTISHGDPLFIDSFLKEDDVYLFDGLVFSKGTGLRVVAPDGLAPIHRVLAEFDELERFRALDRLAAHWLLVESPITAPEFRVDWAAKRLQFTSALRFMDANTLINDYKSAFPEAWAALVFGPTVYDLIPRELPPNKYHSLHKVLSRYSKKVS